MNTYELYISGEVWERYRSEKNLNYQLIFSLSEPRRNPREKERKKKPIFEWITKQRIIQLFFRREFAVKIKKLTYWLN